MLSSHKFHVRHFSAGKTPERNEDCFAHRGNSFIMVDGATDKSGRTYGGKTGGELAAQCVAHRALHTTANGTALVADLNQALNVLYHELGIRDLTNNPRYRFAAAFVCLRVTEQEVLITRLGDVGLRLNGKEVLQDTKTIDRINAEARAAYIRKTGDIAGSRAHIMPRLLAQFDYQNQAAHPLGYGVIDGTQTPDRFVHQHCYPLDELKTIELFTDGYPTLPKQVSIPDWENCFRAVERTDPHKCLRYLSTKSRDDRSVAIIRLG